MGISIDWNQGVVVVAVVERIGRSLCSVGEEVLQELLWVLDGLLVSLGLQAVVRIEG